LNQTTPSRILPIRDSSQIPGDFTSNRPVNQTSPSRILLRKNSPMDYSARNEFGFSNRNSRMMSAKVHLMIILELNQYQEQIVHLVMFLQTEPCLQD
jgi:hypothetical protein